MLQSHQRTEPVSKKQALSTFKLFFSGPPNETRAVTQRTLLGNLDNLSGPVSENDTCGVNTIFSLCATTCPAGCDRLEEDSCATTTCTPGCICASGYVRQRANDTGSPCIRESTCGQAVLQPASARRCQDPNADWSTCGSPCEETCQFRPNCPTQCAVGCFCKDGYVKESNSSSSSCVARTQCVQAAQPYQQQCQDPNAVLSNCGSACEETCDNRPTTCALPCTTGCFCNNGFVKESRAPTARCVQRNQCPQTNGQGGNQPRPAMLGRAPPHCSDPNASWSDCGTACPETCRLRKKYCTTPCVAGCFCNDGFVKKSKARIARCVPTASCQQRKMAVSG